MPEDTPVTYREVLDDVTDFVMLMREQGCREIELSAEALQLTPVAVTASPAPPPEASASTISAPPPSAPASAPAVAAPVTAPAAPADSLVMLESEFKACTTCRLHGAGRSQTVPGQGQGKTPELMFVCGAPDADEESQGTAAAGAPGDLLTKMIGAMGYSRDQVFITNVCKCRPPSDRLPTPAELAGCLPYLKRQITLLQPKVIVVFGSAALNGMIDLPPGSGGIAKMRGQWLRFEGIPVMPTYAPAHLHANPADKRPAWQDLQEVMRVLGK
jgi:uracil-DNA glycosylase family 4